MPFSLGFCPVTHSFFFSFLIFSRHFPFCFVFVLVRFWAQADRSHGFELCSTAAALAWRKQWILQTVKHCFTSLASKITSHDKCWAHLLWSCVDANKNAYFLAFSNFFLFGPRDKAHPTFSMNFRRQRGGGAMTRDITVISACDAWAYCKFQREPTICSTKFT